MGEVGVRDNLPLQIKVAKLRHKISSVSTIPRLVSPSSSIAQSFAYSNMLSSNSIIYNDYMRKISNSGITIPQQVTEQPLLQINNSFHENVLQPNNNFLSGTIATVKSNTTKRISEKANTTYRTLEKSNKKPSSAIIGNDLKYFNNLFPNKKGEDKNPRSDFGFNNSIFEPAILNPFALKVVSNVPKYALRGNATSSRIDKNASADKMLTVRQINDSPPITVRLPVLPIEFDRMSDSTEILHAKDVEDIDALAIRRTLGALEYDGGVDIDINSYDDHTKEEFYQRSKMIASNPSVQVLYLPTTAPANSVVLQEGKLDIIELSNIGDIDNDFRSQDIAEEDASSPMQLQGQRKNKSKNKLTISLGAGPAEEAAAVPDQQRPAKEANGKGGMRRTGRSRSSRTLTLAGGAVSSPSTGKVFQCSQCVCKQATLWCSQCSAAYCGICWLRSPAHSKTDIVPVQSCGPKPPYFTVTADSNKSEHVFPKTGFVSSGPCIHNEFKSRIPSSKSQHYLIYHHDFERVGTAARKQKHTLPPVVLDSSGTFLQAQSRADIRPFSRP